MPNLRSCRQAISSGKASSREIHRPQFLLRYILTLAWLLTATIPTMIMSSMINDPNW